MEMKEKCFLNLALFVRMFMVWQGFIGFTSHGSILFLIRIYLR